MFEHKKLDGTQKRLIPASDAFVNGDVLECHIGRDAEPEKCSRTQYGVISEFA